MATQSELNLLKNLAVNYLATLKDTISDLLATNDRIAPISSEIGSLVGETTSPYGYVPFSLLDIATPGNSTLYYASTLEELESIVQDPRSVNSAIVGESNVSYALNSGEWFGGGVDVAVGGKSPADGYESRFKYYTETRSLVARLPILGGYELLIGEPVNQHPHTEGGSDDPDTPVAFSRAAMAPAPGGPFMVGGDGPSGPLDSFYQFEAPNKQYVDVGPLPFGVSGHTFTEINGKYYLFGGERNGTNDNDLHIYDPESDSWTQVSDSLGPQWRYNHCAVHLPPDNSTGRTEDRLYIIGGTDGSSVFNDVHYFNVQTQTWSNAPVTPIPVQGSIAGAYDNTIYLYGGEDDQGDVRNNIWSFDLTQWENQANVSYLAFHAGACVDNYMYVGGGRGIQGDYSSIIFAIDLTTFNSIQVSPSMDTPAINMACCASNNLNRTVSFLGGEDSGGNRLSQYKRLWD